MSEELLNELSAEELKPPKYYPIEYAMMWVAFGNKPINMDYAKIIYGNPPTNIVGDDLKAAQTKLLTYLRSGKIRSQSMDYKQDKDGNYNQTGKFNPIDKDMWSNLFGWHERILNYKDEKGNWFELTHIQVNTEDLMKCSPIVNQNKKIVIQAEKKNALLKPVEKSINTKERDTLLKMIIGMAVKGYAYDPKAKKSSSIKEISDDLASLGISLDADTIRKWIKEAADMLPRDNA